MKNADNRAEIAWAGIDVAKGSFEAAVHPAWVPGRRMPLADLPKAGFARTVEGVAEFLGWLDGTNPPAGVRAVMEATGRYSTELADLLAAARPSLAPSVADPKTVCHFARSLRLRNKTDRADAAALARFGAERCPEPWRPPTPEYAALREMVRQRTFLVGELTAARNRLAEIDGMPAVAKVQQRVVADLEKALAKTEELMRGHVAKHPALAEAVAHLDSMPGVAFVTAATVLGELGDITRFPTSRALAAFAGLSPRRFESGTSVHGRTRMCKQGSPEVRRVLYMAAMTAVGRPGNRFARGYDAMVAAGKPRMVALGAAMRKMLVAMRAMLLSGADYRDEGTGKKTEKIA